MRIKEYSRYELKYLLTRGQAETLIEAMSTYEMEPDTQGDEWGRYLITSLYHDTEDYKSYWDKLEGHRFRRKVRIRVYGDQKVTPETRCFVEIKQRINKTLQKKRVVLPYATAAALCAHGQEVEGEVSEAALAVIREVQYLNRTLDLQPSCVVTYHRVAFDGSAYDPGLRVTFDTNLKGRVHDLSLLSHGQAENHYFLPPEWSVMEIKVNHRVPFWLTELVGRYRCTLRRISKYCSALEQNKVVLQRQRILY
jgi:SPX domain protein involved in polyphosphate accumulation